ncbi:chitinase [Saccharopolyspora sp. 6T]|uniref:glycosyl hydrolase family 18 protein n=1 Tax=Saccharopolyspora sp. 6T TaxID=2877238 RepID=UPI001CD3312B|nr:glycosyl hydrolase family 18 protein [Saccharopolyspora sp. 6T]MCA1188821.1 chitinase [Saccharopolyspora sp. 6T]
MSLQFPAPHRVGVRRAVLVAATAVVLAVVLALVVEVRPRADAAGGEHAVMYYQTQYDGDRYVSPRELTDHDVPVTDLIVGAIHLNSPTEVHLNDDPPDDPKFDPMWTDLAAVQDEGVRVLGMVGGAGHGSFQRLDAEFDTYYPLLRDLVAERRLDGIDLNVEEEMSLAGIERVITALRADFGPDFVISMGPVASALSGGGNLSGFDYDRLYRDVGEEIAFFNAQFYNGWGDASSTSDFDAIVERGVIPADRIAVTALTNGGNGGSGYVDASTLRDVLAELRAKYPEFGGITGWEYFNAAPAAGTDRWRWLAELAPGA